MAALATPPEAGAAAYFHVVSGARNPLTFRQAVRRRPRLLRRAPLRRRRPRVGPAPGVALPRRRRASSGCWPPASARTRSADYLVGHAPRSDRTLSIARNLDRQGRRLEFLRRYLDLYREYAEAELRFDDAHTRRPARGPPPRRPRGVRLRHRRGRLGPLPRARCTARRSRPRSATLDEVRRARAEADDGQRSGRSSRPSSATAAFFDMDGTLLSSNVIETYLWMRLQELSPAERRRRARPDRDPPARAWSAPSAASAARSCARSTASTPAPGSPTSTAWSTRCSPTTSCRGSRPPPYAASASTAQRATPPSSSPARSGR